MPLFAHQETVGTTAIIVAQKANSRTTIKFMSLGTVRIGYGQDPSITMSTAFIIQPNQEREYRYAWYDEVVLPWYAIADAASQTLSIFEVLEPTRSRGVEGVS